MNSSTFPAKIRYRSLIGFRSELNADQDNNFILRYRNHVFHSGSCINSLNVNVNVNVNCLVNVSLKICFFYLLDSLMKGNNIY